MKEQFTPGPWTYSPQKSKPGHGFVAQVWDKTGHNLAAIEMTESEDEATATAALIAAAPDMYEALKNMIEFIDQYGIYDKNGVSMEMDAPLAEMNAALSKANPQ